MIEQKELEEFIGKGLTQYEIAKKCNCSQTKIRYWLKKYDLKTKNSESKYKTKIFTIFCTICGKYMGENSKNRSKCMSCITKIRRARIKLAAVKMLGGQCEICGWTSNETGSLAAFEFHHKEKQEKDFEISDCMNKSWEIVKDEIKKCALLCSRCHRILHAERYNEEFMQHVYDYHGDQLDF